jgi:hypothetical protein
LAKEREGKMNKSIPTIVIDSQILDRSKPLLDKLEAGEFFSTTNLRATMISNWQSEHLSSIDFDNEVMRRWHQRDFFPGEIGCAHSHNMARELASNFENGAIIFEDDARISDPVALAELVSRFSKEIDDEFAVLSLVDFLTVGRSFRGKLGCRVRFLKLQGKPPLAVGYFLTKSAAKSLQSANTPIRYVADWPEVEINYYTSSHSFVTHGDQESSSLIEQTSLLTGMRTRDTRQGLIRYLSSLWRSRSWEIFIFRIKASLIHRFDKVRVMLLFRFSP